MAPVTETQSLVPSAAQAERAAETRRRGYLFGGAKRIEVRRQGVGSNAGPHFRFWGLTNQPANNARARSQSAAICAVSASRVSNFASGRR